MEGRRKLHVGHRFGSRSQRAVWCHGRPGPVMGVRHQACAREMNSLMSRHLAASDFVSCVGKTFTAKGQHRALTLFSVNRSVPPGGEVLPREPFMLKRWPAQARTLRYQKQCLVLQQPRELARALREAR